MHTSEPPNALGAIYVTRDDFDQLSERAHALLHTPNGRRLQAELDRSILAPAKSTRSFVRLGSVVTYEDLRSGAVRRLTLCLPEEASLDDARLSVLTPVGVALIGARVGQSFDYITGDGQWRRLRVLEVSDVQ